jgi:transcriptional regulator with XRE-family HTH domain
MTVLLKDRLENLRRARKLRQKEMAALLDIPVGTYRSYAWGKRTPTKITMVELERRIEEQERA